MPTRHTVRPGECLASIARQNGFASWRAIYDHPDNAALRAQRPNPNVLRAGDVVVIPDKKTKTVPLATGQAHKVVVGFAASVLNLELRGFDGEPLAGVSYKLQAGANEIVAKTGSDGRISAPIDGLIVKGTLTVWMPGRKAPHVFDLEIGDLDPVHSFRGMEQRLANLGYACPTTPPSKTVPPTLMPFVQAFKNEAGLPVDPHPELTFQAALEKYHGC